MEDHKFQEPFITMHLFQRECDIYVDVPTHPLGMNELDATFYSWKVRCHVLERDKAYPYDLRRKLIKTYGDCGSHGGYVVLAVKLGPRNCPGEYYNWFKYRRTEDGGCVVIVPVMATHDRELMYDVPCLFKRLIRNKVPLGYTAQIDIGADGRLVCLGLLLNRLGESLSDRSLAECASRCQ